MINSALLPNFQVAPITVPVRICGLEISERDSGMILSLIPSPKCTFFRLNRSTWPTEPALSACSCVVHDNWWHVLKLGESWGNASNQNQRFLDRYKLPTGCVECKVQGYRFDPAVSIPIFHCGIISQSIISQVGLKGFVSAPSWQVKILDFRIQNTIQISKYPGGNPGFPPNVASLLVLQKIQKWNDVGNPWKRDVGIVLRP